MKNESQVNSYSKIFPTIFEYASGDIITDTSGKKYLDFFSGAGALNYGHNNPLIKQAILSFLNKDFVVHCLDMDTKTKESFLDKFDSFILKPRALNYKMQFCGPTGTNAVEAAVKLARKVTGRKTIISFTNSFHGMTATSLALSGLLENNHKVNPPQEVLFFPFDGFLGKNVNTINYLKKMIDTPGSGIELPAAIIVETIQAEGGVNIASIEWLQELRSFTQKKGIVLIVDDIQVGCGRTGFFFSFERANIVPDIVLLSKSISGYGLPLSLVLMKPELDVWNPGEYNGTFRANNLSLISACKALDFWKDDSLIKSTAQKSKIIKNKLNILLDLSIVKDIRGFGLIWGIEFVSEKAKKIAHNIFLDGMLIEACGHDEHILKLLPPLTISDDNLIDGLDKIISNVVKLDLK